jgi:CHAD domain-containing protein
MQLVQLEYSIPDGTDPRAIAAAIRAHGACLAESPRTIERRFLDNFDWSLYLAGAALEERHWPDDPEPARYQLLWHDLKQPGGSTIDQWCSSPAGVLTDLAPGPVHERLAPLLGIRRLLPVVTLRGRMQAHRLLNADDKTIARIIIDDQTQLEAVSPADPAAATKTPLSGRLRLQGVRGYQRELQAARTLIEDHLGMKPTETPLLMEALACTSLRPGGYSSKLDYRLDPAQRADAATKCILLDLLDTLEANIDGTRSNLDSEFLHDLRVATRRTRSALSQIKGVFADAVVDDYKARFAWLQQITGPVRDLDVYLLDFPHLRESLPAPLRPRIDPLRDHILAHYDSTQSKLAAELAGRRFRTLLKDWRAFLEAPVPEPPPPKPSKAGRPIKTVADARIWRMYQRVLSEGRAIHDNSPAEDLHELRKSCKKLRYLMEFFESLYPKDCVKDLIKQLKVLLDMLGRFQDQAVQAAHLEEIAVEMHREGLGDVDTLIAMGALVGQLLSTQQQARGQFAEVFARFDDMANAERFDACFRSKGKREVRQ